MKKSFKLHLAVLVLGVAVPTAAFALEAGIREAPAKEMLAVPTVDVSPQEQALIGAPLPPFWNDASEGRRRMEGADQDARRRDHQDAAGLAREIRRQVRAGEDRAA